MDVERIVAKLARLHHRVFVQVPAQAIVANWLSSFKDFPIRQKPASFNLDEVMRKIAPSSD
jgi:arylsulfatase